MWSSNTASFCPRARKTPLLLLACLLWYWWLKRSAAPCIVSAGEKDLPLHTSSALLGLAVALLTEQTHFYNNGFVIPIPGSWSCFYNTKVKNRSRMWCQRLILLIQATKIIWPLKFRMLRTQQRSLASPGVCFVDFIWVHICGHSASLWKWGVVTVIQSFPANFSVRKQWPAQISTWKVWVIMSLLVATGGSSSHLQFSCKVL